METELLRSFTAVARTGSFTAAARELGYVQSTVTGHLQALERQLGVRLLDRLPTGAVPTEAGTRLLPYAAQFLDLEARMVDDVPARPGRPAGRVLLTAPESMCAYRLPELVKSLRAAAPEVQVSLAPAGTAHALAAVRAGTTDAALVLEPVLAAADVRLEALGVEELTWLTAPASGRTEEVGTWADLAAGDVLLLEEGCSYSDDVARQLLAAGQPGSRRTRFGSIEAVKRCVGAGLGRAVLPTVTAVHDLDSGTLIALQAPLPPAPVVHLITHPARTPGTATLLFLDHLRALWAPGP